ncbi:MAG: galactose-1-phosphate uridylyltransferase [Thermodesulfobacteriota bacterium]
MPELRKDPIVGRWVIISTERGKRPSSFHADKKVSAGGFCPLCPGNEDKTPPEVFAYRSSDSLPDTPGWSLRVVSNKFPALRIEGELDRRGEGIYDKMNGVGAHEVIIECPDHDKTLSSVSVSHFEKVLLTYRNRIKELCKDKRFRYISIFRNQGEAAGASLAHPHSQIIALPVVPKRLKEELNGAGEYFNYKERCIYCDIVRQEKEQSVRIINENHDFLAIAPFASRFPFEAWILPQRHNSSFEETPEGDYASLAEIFSDVLKRLNKVLGDPPYNFILHTSPVSERINDHYHWHFEIIPRLTRIAGFEWGSGFYINPTTPEDAAKFMREDLPTPSGA